jgi:hypothetical protein
MFPPNVARCKISECAVIALMVEYGLTVRTDTMIINLMLMLTSSAIAFESLLLLSQIHQFDSSWSDARRHTYVTHAHREYLIQKVLAMHL